MLGIRSAFGSNQSQHSRPTLVRLNLESLETREVPATLVWRGDGNANNLDNWSLASNWNDDKGFKSDIAPMDGDTIRFTNASNDAGIVDLELNNITLEIDSYTKSFRLDKSITVSRGFMKTLTPTPNDVTVTGSADFVVAKGGTFTWESGTFAGAGKIVVSAGATLDIKSDVIPQKDARLAGRDLEVKAKDGATAAGIVNFSSGQIFVQNDPTDATNATSIENSGQFNITGTATRIAAGQPATFTNKAGGQVKIDLAQASGGFAIESTFNTASIVAGGGVSVSRGRLKLQGGGTSTGTWNVIGTNPLSMISFGRDATGSPAFRWENGTVFSGGGLIEIGKGTVTIPTATSVTMDSMFRFYGGVLKGESSTSTLQLMSQAIWSGGRTEGKGAISVAKAKTLFIAESSVPSSENNPTLAGWKLLNTGSIEIGGDLNNPSALMRVDFRMGDGAVIENAAGGVIRIRDNSNILQIGTRGLIDIAGGEMIKEKDSGVSDFQVRIKSSDGKQVTTLPGSGYRILLPDGKIDGEFSLPETAPAPRKLSFIGPIDFDDNPIKLAGGAQLVGDGTVTTALFTNGGTVLPGDAGAAGQLTFVGGYTQTGSLAIDIGGGANPVAGTDYDQLVVTPNGAAVTLGGTLTLSALSGFAPSAGASYTLVENTGTGPTSGYFTNLPEGAVTYLGGIPFRITYKGGDGNDVVLTRGTVELSGVYALTGIYPGQILVAVSVVSTGPGTDLTWTYTLTNDGFGPADPSGYDWSEAQTSFWAIADGPVAATILPLGWTGHTWDYLGSTGLFWSEYPSYLPGFESVALTFTTADVPIVLGAATFGSDTYGEVTGDLPVPSSVSTQPTGTVTGNVWVDLDRDGVRETGEGSPYDYYSAALIDYGNFFVQLVDGTSGAVVQETFLLGADGSYTFNGVAPGTYRVVIVVEDLYYGEYSGGGEWFAGRLSLPNVGADDLDNDFAPIPADPRTGVTSAFAVVGRQTVNHLDAGIWWYDPDGVGVGEPGIFQDELV